MSKAKSVLRDIYWGLGNGWELIKFWYSDCYGWVYVPELFFLIAYLSK